MTQQITDLKAVQSLTTITTNNNNNNSYSLSPSEDEQTNNLDAPGLGLAPCGASGVESFVSGVGNPATEKNVVIDNTIPDHWDYIKIDLFDNSKLEDLVKGKTKLKVALNVKKSGQTQWNSFNAGLNSPVRSMKRNLDSVTWNGPHYMTVRENHAELKKEYQDVRASKFFEKGYKGKGESVERLSVIVAQHPNEGCYVVNLIVADQQWIWLMRGGSTFLTSAQRETGMIATVGVRRGPKIKNKDVWDVL
jgi:hypothetical protein